MHHRPRGGATVVRRAHRRAVRVRRLRQGRQASWPRRWSFHDRAGAGAWRIGSARVAAAPRASRRPHDSGKAIGRLGRAHLSAVDDIGMLPVSTDAV
jgi:hypothetical protein